MIDVKTSLDNLARISEYLERAAVRLRLRRGEPVVVSEGNALDRVATALASEAHDLRRMFSEYERLFQRSPRLKRMWINAPSAHSAYHDQHGRRVLVSEEAVALARPPTDLVHVHFAEGHVVSQLVIKDALSDGWPS